MVLEPHAVAGNVSLLELLFINRLVKHFRCERIFEIGTFDGRTAMNMAANASQLSTVFTLNLSEDDLGSTALAMMPAEAEYVRKGRSGARFKGSRYAERITQLLGDSATFDYSPYLGTMDLVFVDGSHAYDYVLNDSAVALKLVRKDRGIVLWHDYDNWPQAREALNHLYASDSAFRNMRYITGTSFVIQTQEAISGGLT
jgi:predicted O-methyltransferase YrrM